MLIRKNANACMCVCVCIHVCVNVGKDSRVSGCPTYRVTRTRAISLGQQARVCGFFSLSLSLSRSSHFRAVFLPFEEIARLTTRGGGISGVT